VKKVLAIALALVAALNGACSPSRVFYYPNKHLYVDPKNIGINYELLEYPSLNGKKLIAIRFETKSHPKGTIVHFHGNFGNVSNHFMESEYLVNYGFDVIVFDYQGFGGSQGNPSPAITIEDGLATVRFALKNGRSPHVALLGQSMGAAVATVVAAEEPAVEGVVLEAGFTSYRAIMRHVLRRSAWTWIVYPFYPLLIGHRYDPDRFIARISPRPILFIHGDADRLVPYRMSQTLYDKAGEPKEIWIVPGAGHLECRRKASAVYEKRIADFFTRAMAASQKR